MTQSPDIINQLAGVEPGSPLDQLRQQRPEVARYSQGSYDTLLQSGDLGGLSQVERELVALRIATLLGNAALAAHHQARLRGLGTTDALIAASGAPDTPGLAPRTAAILRHVDLVSNTPHAASQAAIQELQASGLATPQIVALGQLIAFAHFQVRVLAGLRLLAEEAR